MPLLLVGSAGPCPPCKEPCSRDLHCAHPCKARCAACPPCPPCKELCSRERPCGHICDQICHDCKDFKRANPGSGNLCLPCRTKIVVKCLGGHEEQTQEWSVCDEPFPFRLCPPPAPLAPSPRPRLSAALSMPPACVGLNPPTPFFWSTPTRAPAASNRLLPARSHAGSSLYAVVTFASWAAMVVHARHAITPATGLGWPAASTPARRTVIPATARSVYSRSASHAIAASSRSM